MANSVVEFTPDRDTYIRGHIKLAAFFMAAAMGVLWLMDKTDLWVGAIGALAAVVVRGWYLMSEELAAIWRIEGDAVIGPAGQSIPLSSIAKVNTLGSYVQIVTKDGHKHLIRHQKNAQATQAILQGALS